MDKFASPQDLLAELRRLTAYCQQNEPSRARVASALIELAVRVAGEDIEATEFPTQKALDDYMKKHPKGKPSNHSVRDPSKPKAPKAPKKPKSEPVKPAPEEPKKPKGPVNYNHRDVNDLAHSFRDLDNRKTRMDGLQNSKRLIDHYYHGQAAKDMHKTIDEMIDEEKKNPKPLGLEHHVPDPKVKK